MEILILIYTILYIILAWKRLDLATALLIIVLPVYQIRFTLGFIPGAGFLPMTVLEVMILVLFTVWFIKYFKEKKLPLFFPKLKNVRHYPFYIEIIFLLIIAFISAGVAGFSMASLGILKAYFIEPIMFFIVFVNMFSAQGGPALGWKAEKNREKIFWALAISAFIISAVAIYQKLTGNLMPLQYADSGRVTGVFNYPNALGLYLGPVVMVLVGWLLSLRGGAKRRRGNPAGNITLRTGLLRRFIPIIIGISLLAMTVLAIFLAKSEGALVAVVAALFIFGLLYNKKSRWAAVGIAVITVGVILGFGTLRDYAKNKMLFRDLDGQIRRQVYKESWTMLMDGRVFSGAGLASYQRVVAPYHQEGIFVKDFNDPDWLRKVRFDMEFNKRAWQPLEIYLYPHNIFLNFWSEIGLIGMVIIIWIIVKYFLMGMWAISKEKIRPDRASVLRIGLICAMVVIVVHGLVDVPYFKNDLAIIFWMLIGMMGVLNYEVRSRKYEV